MNTKKVPFYVEIQTSRRILVNYLSLDRKSEEEVSSAGEQLTSNRIYDGEYQLEPLMGLF